MPDLNEHADGNAHPATAGVARAIEPVVAVPRRRFWVRVNNVIATELGALHLRFLVVRVLVALLPRLSFARLRALVYRAGGVDVGRGTLILGSLDVNWQIGSLRNLHIGARCMINTPCFIDLNDAVHVEDDVNIGHHVVLCTSNHLIGEPIRRAGRLTSAPIRLGKGCWLGTMVTVLPGVTIGSGAVVAAGAMVTADIPPNVLAGGVPAKVIRELPLHPVHPADLAQRGRR